MFAGDAELYQALSSKTLYVQQPSLMELNDRQRAIFRGTWDLILKDGERTGERVFVTLFQQQPLIKSLFPFIAHGTDGDVIVNKSLKAHAVRFMELFSTIVSAICEPPYTLDSVQAIVDNLGSIHQRSTRGRIRTEYWSTLLECMLIELRKSLKKAALEPEQLSESMILWRAVIEWTITSMRRACDDKGEQRRATAETL